MICCLPCRAGYALVGLMIFLACYTFCYCVCTALNMVAYTMSTNIDHIICVCLSSMVLSLDLHIVNPMTKLWGTVINH